MSYNGSDLERRKQQFLDRLPNTWELVGEYKNSTTRTLFRHKVCGEVYEKTPFVILQNPNRCQFCNRKRLMMTDEEFRNKCSDKLDSYELMDVYAGFHSKIRIRHKECGRVFEQTPCTFLHAKGGCPYCKNKLISDSHTLTTEEFWAKLGDKTDEYELLSEYTGAKNKIRVRHRCGNEFEVIADNFARGSRCKQCKYSTGEGQVYKFVKSICPDAEQGITNILPGRFELDIYIPSKQIAIEYDGLRYHTVEHFEKQKRSWELCSPKGLHLWKTNECLRRGIRLIHIFEDEWSNEREIVEDKLRSILNSPMPSIFARKTSVSIVSRKEARAFLEDNHIQGASRSKLYVGLEFEGRLVAIQGFSELRSGLGGKSGEWELQRYVTKNNTKVVGGFSKCLKYFERQYQPIKIISYGDIRWVDQRNNVYLKNGFVDINHSLPSYSYVKGNKRYHRFGFRKEAIRQKFPDIYNSSKTERQMMRDAGYERIYDCGVIRYEKVTP